MEPSVADGLCAEMIVVLPGEAQAAHVPRTSQQVFQPLADFFIPAAQAVRGNIVEAVLLYVAVKLKIFLCDVGIVAQL